MRLLLIFSFCALTLGAAYEAKDAAAPVTSVDVHLAAPADGILASSHIDTRPSKQLSSVALIRLRRQVAQMVRRSDKLAKKMKAHLIKMWSQPGATAIEKSLLRSLKRGEKIKHLQKAMLILQGEEGSETHRLSTSRTKPAKGMPPTSKQRILEPPIGKKLVLPVRQDSVRIMPPHRSGTSQDLAMSQLRPSKRMLVPPPAVQTPPRAMRLPPKTVLIPPAVHRVLAMPKPQHSTYRTENSGEPSMPMPPQSLPSEAPSKAVMPPGLEMPSLPFSPATVQLELSSEVVDNNAKAKAWKKWASRAAIEAKQKAQSTSKSQMPTAHLADVADDPSFSQNTGYPAMYADPTATQQPDVSKGSNQLGESMEKARNGFMDNRELAQKMGLGDAISNSEQQDVNIAGGELQGMGPFKPLICGLFLLVGVCGCAFIVQVLYDTKPEEMHPQYSRAHQGAQSYPPPHRWVQRTRWDMHDTPVPAGGGQE